MSGSFVRSHSSTTIPSSTFSPAAFASSTSGTTPSPATTPSTTISIPSSVSKAILPSRVFKPETFAPDIILFTPLALVEVRHKFRQRIRENPPANCSSRKQHRHFLSVQCQRRRDFRADKPCADDREVFALFRQLPQPLVIRHRAIIDDVISGPKRQRPHPPARCQQKLFRSRTSAPDHQSRISAAAKSFRQSAPNASPRLSHFPLPPDGTSAACLSTSPFVSGTGQWQVCPAPCCINPILPAASTRANAAYRRVRRHPATDN